METVTGQGVGARLLRKEDDRLLRGRGQFVADIRLAGMRDVAFVRSPLAHARLRGVRVPDQFREAVFTAADLARDGVKWIRAVTALRGFKVSEQPILAADKIRFVGELVAMCMADTRAQAEDIAATVSIDADELPAVYDMLQARQPGAPLVHEHWSENVFLESFVEKDIEKAFDAPIKVTREIRTARQCMAPIEGRGVVATWDTRKEQLTLYSAAQMPHIVRTGLSECLGLDHGQIRVVSPDVGGGFGYKGILLAEEVALGWLAMRCGHPVRWIEDRREHLMASVHARDHFYDLTISAEADGTLLGVEGEVYIDAGAYALWPTGSFMEASMASRNLTGPYRIRHLNLKTFTVATNKAPMGPYRGVARPGACFAIERLVDEVARELGREPFDLRRQNIVTAAEMPYQTAAGMRLDTGDYIAALDLARDMINLPAIRERQLRGESDGRAIGLGFAFYTEQSGHGQVEWVKRKSRVVPGYESANARMLPDGTVIIHVGTQNHGQGHETTLSQIAAHELTIDPSRISVRYGDTATTPFGFGTFASRTIVFAGGAVARASRTLGEKIQRIGAHLLQADVANTRLEAGAVHGPSGSVSFAEIAQAANIRQEHLPTGLDPLLDVTATYEPKETGGVFSYGTHAVVVAVEPDTGSVEILDYAVSEDCGTMINPMIVDGQVQGGIAQGIGTALYEEIPYDEIGQPLATTFGDYMMPCAPEIPTVRMAHLVHPAQATEYGVKGLGEGGAIPGPALLANAVEDALLPFDLLIDEVPLTPDRLRTLLRQATARTT
jgi:carbon-monoxide dehydrogenase large subunit